MINADLNINVCALLLSIFGAKTAPSAGHENSNYRIYPNADQAMAYMTGKKKLEGDYEPSSFAEETSFDGCQLSMFDKPQTRILNKYSGTRPAHTSMDTWNKKYLYMDD